MKCYNIAIWFAREPLSRAPDIDERPGYGQCSCRASNLDAIRNGPHLVSRPQSRGVSHVRSHGGSQRSDKYSDPSFSLDRGLDRCLLAPRPVQDLAQLGVRAEQALRQRLPDPAFLDKAPYRRAPLLELDDGTLIFEAMAICRYFEAQYPDPPLMGADALEIARVEMWERMSESEGLFAGRALLGIPGESAQIPELIERGRQRLADRDRGPASEARHPEGPDCNRSEPDFTIPQEQIDRVVSPRTGFWRRHPRSSPGPFPAHSECATGCP